MTRASRKSAGRRPGVPAAHYLLGLTLEAQGRGEMVLKHLEDSAPSFPKAHMFAARILSKSGCDSAARGHRRQYLLSGDTRYRDKVLAALAPAKTKP